MKILLVDVNYDHRSPMYRQFHTSLAYCFDVDYFGPGYVEGECLRQGIHEYISKRGPYDAVIMTTAFLSSTQDNRTRQSTYSWHRSTIPYYKIGDALKYCHKVYTELLSLTGVVKLYEQHDDVGSMSKQYYRLCVELVENGFYILSWPIEYMSRYSGQYQKGLTNYTYELSEKYDSQYIPIPLHAIGFHEIFRRNFSERKFTWCVPGNRQWKFYSERKEAYDFIRKHTKMWHYDPYQMLTNEKIDRRHMKWYQFRNPVEKLLTLLYGKTEAVSVFPKTEYIAASREVYFGSMRQSKFVYCDGGVPNCFVRKYFEACANGAVLVTKKVPGMEKMGFVHETNCIVIDSYEDIKAVQKKYTEKECRRIAENGQKLILEKHMYHHRAEALAGTISAIKEGNYRGAYWEDGSYILRS